ncbi:MAG: nucleotidyltransferase domain-containing protein [Candidatus Obscuribacterales bacterium]|nr:nucleotidyltransferase domain-containing protein [Candidatus Obscuribacterales bacterium]
MQFPSALYEAANQSHPLIFATVSGAHLYGFPSPDSDFDLRGCHVLPVSDLIGLESPAETMEISKIQDGIELDLVTHDAKKFFLMMLQKNGYVLEQLYSPLIVVTSKEHEELKEIGKRCITKNHSYHYLGFSLTQWRLFSKQEKPRVKPLLYVYRVLLTGIHLMQTGTVEANLVILNEKFKLPHIPELIQQKLSGTEKQQVKEADMDFHEREYTRLRNLLEEECSRSNLPDQPSARRELDDVLRRVRLAGPSESEER